MVKPKEWEELSPNKGDFSDGWPVDYGGKGHGPLSVGGHIISGMLWHKEFRPYGDGQGLDVIRWCLLETVADLALE